LAFVNDPLVVIEFDDQKKTRRLIAVMAARVLLVCYGSCRPTNAGEPVEANIHGRNA
jgi:hypothetical protein